MWNVSCAEMSEGEEAGESAKGLADWVAMLSISIHELLDPPLSWSKASATMAAAAAFSPELVELARVRVPQPP